MAIPLRHEPHVQVLEVRRQRLVAPFRLCSRGPTGAGDPDLLLLGGWNAYPREDANGTALAVLARRLRSDTRESQRTLTL